MMDALIPRLKAVSIPAAGRNTATIIIVAVYTAFMKLPVLYFIMSIIFQSSCQTWV